MATARYVDRWNARSALQPFQITDAHMYMFAFRSGDPGALQRLCDRYLNEPLGAAGRFVPLGYVFFSFTWIPWVASTMPPYSEWGGSTERELAIWVPVTDTRSLISLPRWFAPYLFVDSSMAVWQGRETYGLAKEVASFEPDFAGDLPHPPASFSVSALAVPTFKQTATPTTSPLVRVYRDAEAFSPVFPSWSTFAEIAADAAKVVMEIEQTVVPPLLPPHGTLLALKQFPDERDGRLACYQRLLEIPCTVQLSGFQPGGLAPGYRLALTPADSHPIATDTGLAGTGEAAVFGCWLRCSFTLDNAVPL